MFSLWVIFDHPRDYPDGWVLREQRPLPNGEVAIAAASYRAATLEQVRAALPPDLTLLHGPGVDPDPHIYEVWI